MTANLVGQEPWELRGASDARLRALETRATALEADSGWVDATSLLVNSWVSYDTDWGPPRYRLIRKTVYLTGVVKNGTIGSTVLTLPAGYRPSKRFLISSSEGEPAQAARLDVYETGVVTHAGTKNGYFSLHTSFPVA